MGVGIGVGAAFAVEDQRHGGTSARAGHGRCTEGAQQMAARLNRTVGQVREVRCGEREGICGRKQLGGHPPAGPGGRHDLHDCGPVLEPARPDERGGDVDVCVGRVHREVGSVHAISVDPVPHSDRSIVLPHDPAVRNGVLDQDRLAGPISGLQVEDVRGELVQRVSARRGPAHHELHGPGHRRQQEVDLHDALTGLIEAEAVVQCRWGGRRVCYSTLSVRQCREGADEQNGGTRAGSSGRDCEGHVTAGETCVELRGREVRVIILAWHCSPRAINRHFATRSGQ